MGLESIIAGMGSREAAKYMLDKYRSWRKGGGKKKKVTKKPEPPQDTGGYKEEGKEIKKKMKKKKQTGRDILQQMDKEGL